MGEPDTIEQALKYTALPLVSHEIPRFPDLFTG